METKVLKKTPLYSLHVQQSARMVPFAGYSMPVQYSNGVKREHLHTRKAAGLFDVSHMGQITLTGQDPAQELEALVPGKIKGLDEYAQRYTVMTNENGGIIDDLMVTNMGDRLFLVINAACKEKDIHYIRENLSDRCTVEELVDFSLLALQGPEASAIMQRLCPAASELDFMTCAESKLQGVDCMIHRCGYTGEDGFEISIPNSHVENIARLFLAQDEVEPIGLGARDTLRLEAGYCLYGHELDETTTPVEANLEWIISKSRLQESTGIYPGSEIIKQQLRQGTTRLRVGIISEDRAPLREDTAILNTAEETIGTITSGGFGPSTEKPIAMGYIDKQFSAAGTPLIAMVRGRIQHVKVVELPFIEHRYFRSHKS